jgi:hypothetical protein
MNANLTTYFWAEQTDRERLPRQAERGWLAEQAAHHHTPSRAARLWWVTGTLFVRLGAHLQGVGSVPPFASPDAARSRG